MKVPFLYVIHKIAEKWGIPPWEIDLSVPHIRESVRVELRILEIEGEAQTFRKLSGIS